MTRAMLVAATFGVAVAAVPSPAVAQAGALVPMGGPRKPLELCGERHVVLVRTLGRRVSIGRGRGLLHVDRCEAGRWVRFARVRLNPRRRRALPSATPGSFR